MDELDKVKVATAAIVIVLYCDDETEKRRRKRRRHWVKPWLQRRDSHGFYSQLLSELRLEEVNIYKNYLRMTPDNFDEVLTLIKADVTKNDTIMRESIPPEIQLAITIRFLATGNSYRDLSTGFRVHETTIGKFVPKVCQAIYTRLKDKYFQVIQHNIIYYTYKLSIKNYNSLDCR